MPKLFLPFLFSIFLLLDYSEGRRFNFKNLFNRDTEQIRSCDSRRSVPCTDCKFKCPLNDGRFARPDCKTYYKCVGGEKACLATCPRFTRYDVRWERCLPAGFARCFLEESFDCSNRTGIFRHRRYCDRYFICRNGHAYLRFCPYWYSFDEISNKCKPSVYAQCEEIVPTTAAPPTPTTKITTTAATNVTEEESLNITEAAVWETITVGTTEVRQWSTEITTTSTSTSTTTEPSTTASTATFITAKPSTSTPFTKTTVTTKRPNTSTTTVATTSSTQVPVTSTTEEPTTTVPARITEAETESTTTSTTTEASTVTTTTMVTEVVTENNTSTTITEASTTTATEAVTEEVSTSQTSTSATKLPSSTSAISTTTTELPMSNTQISTSTISPTSTSIVTKEQILNPTAELPTTTTTTTLIPSTSTSTEILTPSTAQNQTDSFIEFTTKSTEDLSTLVEIQNIFQEELIETESSILDLSLGTTSDYEKSAQITSTETPSEPRIQPQISTTLGPINFTVDNLEKTSAKFLSVNEVILANTPTSVSLSTEAIANLSESSTISTSIQNFTFNSDVISYATSSNQKLGLIALNKSLPLLNLTENIVYELHHRPIEEESKLKN